MIVCFGVRLIHGFVEYISIQPLNDALFIRYRWVCDREEDCADGDDEDNNFCGKFL